LVIAGLVIFCNELVYGDDARLELKLFKDQPCTKGTPYEKIRLPNNDEAPLKPDPDRGDGFYLIKGTVQVLQPITGQLQAYVETKYGTKAPVEECRGADDNGCGGAGSCVYCDLCEGIKTLSKSSAVQLVIGNKNIDCKKGLAKKNYTDIVVSWGMPTRNEFLKSQNIAQDFWDRYGASGQMVFVTMYIFCGKQVNTLSRSELQKIATPESDQICGCHKLVGSIRDPSSSS